MVNLEQPQNAGVPLRRDKLEDSMKVELWAGVAPSGQRLMTWWGCEKPPLKPMKPRASRRFTSFNMKPP